MARLAISIAGGIIGSFFGMPQIGFLVGSLLGALLFPTKGPNGPRLSDLRVTSSTYGEFIIIGDGVMRVGGQVIFADDIKETQHEEGGGLGSGGGGATTYTYSWSGGVSLGRSSAGPILDVSRIWADTKLVYDKTGQTPGDQLAQFKLAFRLYKGSETQLPDIVHETKVGAANAQAYRGMAYIVFDNIPLADYGNRVPAWTFEVIYSAGSDIADQTGHVFDFTTGGVVGTPNGEHCAIDPDRKRAYFFDTGSSADGGIICCDLTTGSPIAWNNTVGAGFPSGDFVDLLLSGVVGWDGYVYCTTNASNCDVIYKVDPDALVVVGHFGVSGSNLDDWYISLGAPVTTGFEATTSMAPMVSSGISYMLCGSIFNWVGAFCTDTMSVNCRPDLASQTVPDERVSVCSGPVGSNIGFVFGHPNTPSTVSMTLYQAGLSANGELSLSVLAVIAPADINPFWTHTSNWSNPIYDFTDGGIIFGVQTNDSVTTGNSQNYIVKVLGGSVVWKAPVSSFNTQLRAFLVDGRLSFIGASSGESFVGAGDSTGPSLKPIYTVQTEDGTVTRDNWPVATPGGEVYIGRMGAIVFNGSFIGHWSNTWGILFNDRVSTDKAVSVGDIVRRYSKMVGYADADLDTTDIDALLCDGYTVSQQTPVADSLKPLAMAFMFDAVESDDTLKFIQRGHASKATVPLTDMAYADTKMNSVAPETRMQEVDLPRQMQINFYDPNHDYQQATQYARRPFNPVPTMYSNNMVTQNLQIVMEPDFAKQLAEKMLYTAWVERVSYKLKLPWKYLKYDPTDNLVITLSDDAQVLTRWSSVDIGVDWSMDVQALSQNNSTYGSSATGYGGDGFPQQTINGSTSTKMFFIDVPLLRDTDDTGLTTTFMYWAAGEYDPTWPGVALWKSNDGTAYADIGGLSTSATWGIAMTALGEPPDSAFVLDHTNSITVRMIAGSGNLASCTYLEMCNGANAAVLVNLSTNTTEIIQFMTVTANTDGTFTLSGLLRGRRGTDTSCAGHSVGDGFVLLTDHSRRGVGGVSKATMDLGDLNVSRFFKGVTVGTLIENAPVREIVDTGATLKPYAPTHVAAALDGSDIDLTWRRRTRVGGSWRDEFSDVPLSETTEAYDVDIYNALGDTVLRTLSVDFGPTPTSDPGLTYAAADIATDFGSTPTELTLAVYQKSAAMGRGFGYIVTVPVTT